jgi:hypothetical protein
VRPPAGDLGNPIDILEYSCIFTNVHRRWFTRLAALAAVSWLPSCARQTASNRRGLTTRREVAYRFVPGQTALLRGGIAYPPRSVPERVKAAIRAGNRLQGKPYKWGGGHARLDDSGYDCSGTVSYVLRAAGLMKGAMPSQGFLDYGKPGPGKWITIYVRRGHVFMTIAGLRLDTGGSGNRTGPRWKPQGRKVAGHVVRHPPGL